MSDQALRSKIIRLAHQRPSLRPHLLPLLVTGGGLREVTSAFLRRAGKVDSLVRRVMRAFVDHSRKELESKGYLSDFKFDLGDDLYVTFLRYPSAGGSKPLVMDKAATFDPNTGEVLLRFRAKKVIDPRDWSGFLKDLKGVLRHELEHVAQFQRAMADEDYPAYWKTVGGSKKSPIRETDADTLRDVFYTVDATISYLTNPAEVEANVASIVGVAKHTRGSAYEEMEQVLDELNLGKHLSASDAAKVREAVRAAWLKYGKARYPKVFKDAR